jgi:hypothetical protein
VAQLRTAELARKTNWAFVSENFSRAQFVVAPYLVNGLCLRLVAVSARFSEYKPI